MILFILTILKLLTQQHDLNTSRMNITYDEKSKGNTPIFY
jgi:hypothetical protein